MRECDRARHEMTNIYKVSGCLFGRNATFNYLLLHFPGTPSPPWKTCRAFTHLFIISVSMSAVYPDTYYLHWRWYPFWPAEALLPLSPWLPSSRRKVTQLHSLINHSYFSFQSVHFAWTRRSARSANCEFDFFPRYRASHPIIQHPPWVSVGTCR